MRDVLRRFKSSSSIALLAALGALIAGAVAAAFGEFPLTVAHRDAQGHVLVEGRWSRRRS